MPIRRFRSEAYTYRGIPRRYLYTCFFALVALMLTMLFITGNSAPLQATAADEPMMIRGTLAPMIAHSHLQGPANTQQRIELSIGLQPQHESSLQHYVQDISRPGSVNYHRFLTPTQFEGVFSPDKAEYAALSRFLQTAGFTITSTYRHRLLLAFSGTIGQAEQTFHIRINQYIAPDGRGYFANASDPILPAWLAGEVQSINGLSNAAQYHHAPLVRRTLVPGHAKPQTSPCPTPGNGYVLPSQVASAYGLSSMYSAGVHGEGQTIALFELSGFVPSDLTGYSSCFGTGKVPVQTMVVGSGPIDMGAGVGEVELDADLVLSAAPQLGSLRIYESSQADYINQWAQIVQDAVPVVSTSWGLCEQLLPSDQVHQENTLFTVAAAQGQSIFAAAGDNGSEDCFGNDSSLTGLGTDDPASQPFVTGVGGTSLTLAGASSYGSETSWNTANVGAGGGGISQYWSSPSWQNAPGVHNSYSSGTPCGAPSGTICREVPDVSLLANPNNGYVVYCTWPDASCDGSFPWFVVGGTSGATPMWAAWMALANQMSVQQGGFNLGFANPLLYQAANNAGTYASGYHDITIGNNDFTATNGGKYPATTAYDMATGLGSFQANALAATIVGLAQSGGRMRSAPTNSTWYFAEGSVGGGFKEYLTLFNPSTSQDATVSVAYLFDAKTSRTVVHTVSRSTRITVSVNADLNVQDSDPQQAVAAVVTVVSGPGIVAERPMYFHYKGIQSGTDVVGATTPGTAYYFPLADTRQSGRSYNTYITMLNPSSSQTATATLTYYTGTCGLSGQAACPTQTVVIAPLHRGTATPLALGLQQQMAVSVTSNQAIVAERPTYMSDTIATAGGPLTGATSVVGAQTLGTDWLFAEGYTGNNFQEYLVLANFATTTTSANIVLKYDNGHTQTVGVTVPALGQYFFDVKQANAHPTGTCDTTPCQTTAATSAEISATAAIVAERLMYFHYSSTNIPGATETVGEAGPASHSVYSFAEGYTTNLFNEYLTLQNPRASDETVAVTLFADTYVFEQQVLVKAHSRYTLSINPLVVPIAQAYNNMGSNSYAVSVLVQALGSSSLIVAERPMYFNFHGDRGGTNVLGYTGG